MSKTVVDVQNLTKIYPLYDRKSDRLKEAISLSKKKRHKEFYALKDISFSVQEGESVGFVGKNGSGKSTLLKMLTGVLTPTSGTYHMEGNISALLELGAGFNQEYTGLENIFLNGSIMGFSREQMDEKVDNILEFADIGEFAYQPVKMYSSGMFVRLAFAVAINVEPDILIVDEALSVGDIFFQQKCYKKFDDFRKAGKTILFVTHDMGSIIRYCNRALLLDSGELISTGTPKSIVDKYKKLMAGVDIRQEEATEREEEHIEKAVDTVAEILDDSREWKSYYTLNPSSLEYGAKDLEIIDFGIFDENNRLVTACNKGDLYTIKVKVKAHKSIEEPIFAFAIKDIKGNEIAGTNTLVEKKEIGTVDKGQTLIITFQQNIWLQNYQYFLSLGCTKYQENGELEIYHRLYDIIALEILAEKNTSGYIDMDSVINIENED